MKITLTQKEVDVAIRAYYRINSDAEIEIVANTPSTSSFSAPDLQRIILLVQDYLDTGNKIGAIKEYRTYSRLGLKEAKDTVENWDNDAKKAILGYGALVRPIYGIEAVIGWEKI